MSGNDSDRTITDYKENCHLQDYFLKRRHKMKDEQTTKEKNREGAEWVVREGVGAGGRNDPSFVCTYE
jgi:hypothetical protein